MALKRAKPIARIAKLQKRMGLRATKYLHKTTASRILELPGSLGQFAEPLTRIAKLMVLRLPGAMMPETFTGIT